MSSFATLKQQYQRYPDYYNLSLAYLLLIFMILGSWRGWGDVYIDFPEELYVPWQLSEGKILYKDINHYYGPLSQYWHALLFKIFGTSYTVLFLSNFFWILLTVLAIYRTFCLLGGSFNSLLITLNFVLIFPTLQMNLFGGYNFMSSYAHEATHGMINFIFMFLFLVKYFYSNKLYFFYLFAFTLGLTALFKPEFILTGAATLLLIIIYKQNCSTLDKSVWIKSFFISISPLFISFLLFKTVMPSLHAFKAALGSISPLIFSNLAGNPIYSTISGTEHLFQNIQNIAVETILLFSFYIAAFALSYFIQKFNLRRFRIAIFLIFSSTYFWIDIKSATLVFPFICIVYSIVSFYSFINNSNSKDRIAYFSFGLFSAISFLFLIKILFRTSLIWLGFYLTLPATICFFWGNVWLLPKIVNPKKISTPDLKIALLALSMVFVFQNFSLTQRNHSFKNIPVGKGEDRMYTFPTPTFVVDPKLLNYIIHKVDMTLTKDETLMVVPEGILINYLTKRVNPTPYLANLMAKTLFDDAGGSAKIIATLREKKPDYIVYLRRVNEVQKPGYFIRGPDGFAEEVFQWIEANYKVIDQVGPFTKDFNRFGYAMLKRTHDS